MAHIKKKSLLPKTFRFNSMLILSFIESLYIFVGMDYVGLSHKALLGSVNMPLHKHKYHMTRLLWFPVLLQRANQTMSAVC